jgi:hypothetical protein
MEQLLFGSPSLITPRTWCNNKANKLYKNLDSTTPMHERYSSLLESTHYQYPSLGSIQVLIWIHLLVCFDF